jgi:hypothetical protein
MAAILKDFQMPLSSNTTHRPITHPEDKHLFTPSSIQSIDHSPTKRSHNYHISDDFAAMPGDDKAGTSYEETLFSEDALDFDIGTAPPLNFNSFLNLFFPHPHIHSNFRCGRLVTRDRGNKEALFFADFGQKHQRPQATTTEYAQCQNIALS